MSQINNFEQLLIVKEVFSDACGFAEKNDLSSLTKAIIFLDLSIEQTLKNILLNLNPNYIIAKGRNDIDFKPLWNEASQAVFDKKKVRLSEQNNCFRLHELRNLVQHNGTQPTKTDVKRYVQSSKKMLINSFSTAFNLDFESLRMWDFVTNNDLREWLNESEDFLKKNNPIISIIGCKFARDWIIGAVHHYTSSDNHHYFDYMREIEAFENGHNALKSTRAISKHLENFSKFILDKISLLESETLLTGLGLPIIDTRRFLEFTGGINEDVSVSGQITAVYSFSKDEINKEEFVDNAKFMLNYLFRLLQLVENNSPEALNLINVKVPLSSQKIAQSESLFD